jgi:hypothetical protein
VKRTRPMTPKRFLARHDFRAHLRGKGITAKQLDGVHLIPIEEVAFCCWLTFTDAGWPAGFEMERRVWAAIRWLALENPPQSHDTAAAWDLVNQHYLTLYEEQCQVRARVEAAAQSRRATGTETIERVRLAFIKQFADNPPKYRDGAAATLAPLVKLTHDATLKILRKLGLPQKQKLVVSNDRNFRESSRQEIIAPTSYAARNSDD